MATLGFCCVVIFSLLFVKGGQADLYGSTPPPPPDSVSGKDFPQSVLCNDPQSKCFGAQISCPSQCPSFKPSNSQDKACFVDCNSRNCEALCKRRRPNCNGIGAACYDPRFVGGDGVMFYFHGKTNEQFSLVSDVDFHINARFIGRRPQGRTRDNTWIQALGLMFGPHTLTLAANKVARWDNEVDQLVLTYDGKPLLLPPGQLSAWTAPDGRLFVERTAKFNSVTVLLHGSVEISVNAVPVTKEDDRIHKYQIPDDDCFAHLEAQFKFLRLSDQVEGVLGQTYRPGYRSPVKRGVSMPIMGGEDKYKTSSLISADCKYCIFSMPDSQTAMIKSIVLDPSMAMIDCTSKISPGHGLVCRR
ncbi:hypothetical protein EUGRSUZ_J01651 [Eucalyptus grandis]|uniref:Late embryogenesis abundant protein LEA-2 subgroup domain-containing protein n=2 Tax=Eucalyptus grandis TaxID=71139 RepID=A0A059AEQ4_EUCGR|nr:hypothetical protein EUGRSUZ_J01651 [Eucalyptus grandis]